MPDTTRTFLAVAVPDALTTRVDRLQQQVAPELPGLRMAAARPHHVTLAFLGDVDNADLNTLCRSAAGAAAAFAPFELKLEGLGVFPNPSRPRVLWAGVAGPGVETLKALQAALAGAAAAEGYPADEKQAFHPHVTLGRFAPGRGKAGSPAPSPGRTLERLIAHYKTWYAGPFGVSEAVVFASTLARDGPVYATLARAPLGGRKSGPSP